MFKVGDKVRRINEPNWNPHQRIEVGDVGTVAAIEGGWLLLKEYEELGYCCAEMFELVEPGPQAAAIAGGLQAHSVGEYYPLAAVMYEHNDKRIITIENLQTGEVSGVGDHVTDWETFEAAYTKIELVAKGQKTWLRTKGRVSYVGGRWVVAEPANPVRVTRLRNMLHRG